MNGLSSSGTKRGKMRQLIHGTREHISGKIEEAYRGIQEGRPAWTRIVSDYFLPSAPLGEGECLDLRAWTQRDGFSCGAIAGWIVIVVVVDQADLPPEKNYGGLVAAPIFSEIAGKILKISKK